MSKKTKKQLKAEIKAEEQKIREKTEIKKDIVLSFDSWFHKRKEIIPRGHDKQVIMASFRSMGVGQEAIMSEFDNALRRYGVKF